MRLLDVGCGPGGLTAELVRRSGAHRVAAVDPTPPFVEACRSRNPGADIRQAAAESLPFADGEFDAALASLVVGFMKEPTTGIQEMARVTAPGGIVAACTLGVGPIGAYYHSLRETHREVLREECWELLGRPTGRFALEATAWFARGVVADAKGRR